MYVLFIIFQMVYFWFHEIIVNFGKKPTLYDLETIFTNCDNNLGHFTLDVATRTLVKNLIQDHSEDMQFEDVDIAEVIGLGDYSSTAIVDLCEESRQLGQRILAEKESLNGVLRHCRQSFDIRPLSLNTILNVSELDYLRRQEALENMVEENSLLLLRIAEEKLLLCLNACPDGVDAGVRGFVDGGFGIGIGTGTGTGTGGGGDGGLDQVVSVADPIVVGGVLPDGGFGSPQSTFVRTGSSIVSPPSTSGLLTTSSAMKSNSPEHAVLNDFLTLAKQKVALNKLLVELATAKKQCATNWVSLGCSINSHCAEDMNIKMSTASNRKVLLPAYEKNNAELLQKRAELVLGTYEKDVLEVKIKVLCASNASEKSTFEEELRLANQLVVDAGEVVSTSKDIVSITSSLHAAANDEVEKFRKDLELATAKYDVGFSRLLHTRSILDSKSFDSLSGRSCRVPQLVYQKLVAANKKLVEDAEEKYKKL